MSVTAQFQDRYEAGRVLASQLGHHATDDSLVLALPRGGVPVGSEIARLLPATLDVFMVLEIVAPGYDELVMGAVASLKVHVLNDHVIQRLGVPETLITRMVAERRRELEKSERKFRGARPPEPIEGRNVILVDDGIAAGSKMGAAVKMLRRFNPARITVAAPVGSADTCSRLRDQVDELVCPTVLDPFYSVGAWYSDFMEVTDAEIQCSLQEASSDNLTRSKAA